MDFSSKYFYFAYKKDYKKRHNLVNEYLIKEYLSNIYIKQKNIPKIVFNKNDYKIWVLWWQGEENMPPIVKLCYNSLKYHARDFEICLITKENINKYIEFPSLINNKKNIFSLAQFSDIIRFYLLKNYGGLWIDATVLLTDDLIKYPYIFENKFYTVKLSKEKEESFNISQNRWCGFLMGTNQINLELFDCGLTLFYKYWKEHDILIDYFLIDYILNFLYENNNKIKYIIDKVEVNNKQIFKLSDIISTDFNYDEYTKIIGSTIFHKLSWKEKYNDRSVKELYSIINNSF